MTPEQHQQFLAALDMLESQICSAGFGVDYASKGPLVFWKQIRGLFEQIIHMQETNNAIVRDAVSEPAS